MEEEDKEATGNYVDPLLAEQAWWVGEKGANGRGTESDADGNGFPMPLISIKRAVTNCGWDELYEMHQKKYSLF